MSDTDKPTILCLSSAATPRYKRNIVQALAYPDGFATQFRYAKQHVDEDVWLKAEAASIIGAEAIICFLDCDAATQQARIIPCRLARIAAAEIEGSTLTLTLQMTAVVNAPSDFATRLLNDAVPQYVEHVLQGQFCSVVKQRSDGIDRVGVDRWEQTVKSLSESAAFENDICFYVVKGLFQVGKRTFSRSDGFLAKQENGVYLLKPNREYELRLYHYFPVEPVNDEPLDPAKFKRFEIGAAFEIRVSPPLVLSTSPMLEVDSPYDIKRVRFRVSSADYDSYGAIAVQWRESKEADPSLDIDLRTKVVGLTRRTYIVGALAGILLALPLIIDFLRKRAESLAAAPPTSLKEYLDAGGNLSPLDYQIMFAYVVFYMIVGSLAAHHIRKPI